MLKLRDRCRKDSSPFSYYSPTFWLYSISQAASYYEWRIGSYMNTTYSAKKTVKLISHEQFLHLFVFYSVLWLEVGGFKKRWCPICLCPDQNLATLESESDDRLGSESSFGRDPALSLTIIIIITSTSHQHNTHQLTPPCSLVPWQNCPVFNVLFSSRNVVNVSVFCFLKRI